VVVVVVVVVVFDTQLRPCNLYSASQRIQKSSFSVTQVGQATPLVPNPFAHLHIFSEQVVPSDDRTNPSSQEAHFAPRAQKSPEDPFPFGQVQVIKEHVSFASMYPSSQDSHFDRLFWPHLVPVTGVPFAHPQMF